MECRLEVRLEALGQAVGSAVASGQGLVCVHPASVPGSLRAESWAVAQGPEEALGPALESGEPACVVLGGAE